MNDTRLYHNPRCSKSRAALELLRERGIEPTVINYLDTPPTADELRALLAMLGVSASEQQRTREPEYADLGLADAGKSEDQLVETMATHPRLIERPVFVHDGRAVIGRPPERVLELLD